MKLIKLFYLSLAMSLASCTSPMEPLKVEVYETSAAGNQLNKIEGFKAVEEPVMITLLPEETFQVITGFGGSFTEASAYLLNQLSKENRIRILDAYFGDEGARYSLTRTHINSCDFSLGNYSYAPVEGDKNLEHFTIEEDRDDIIPMILDAQKISKEGFRIISSPWTAPPWMKDNNDWTGGKLLPEYHGTWALYFSKYLKAYREEGIEIWGITVENEPLGNDNNWESMHFTPEEMNRFVTEYLSPRLESDNLGDVKILGYDQNRGEELKKWADAMYNDPQTARSFDGIAIHWYASTYDYFPESLQYAHRKAPGKFLIQTEACVDAEVPVWKNDDWYWSREATDWGWDWAAEEDKHLHPKYVPVYRYARDIIGCLNNWVDGWIDWNMVLNKQGGPNWFENWCIAPVIVDPDKDEVYFTPLFYTMAHFSRFIRPGAVRIGFQNPSEDLMVTAAKNPDGTFAMVIFNPGEETKGIHLSLEGKSMEFSIDGKAIQTIVIPNDEINNNGNEDLI